MKTSLHMRLTALILMALAAGPARAKIPTAKDLSVEELAGQVFVIAIDTPIAASREADIRAGRLGGGLLRWDKFTADEVRTFSEKMREWISSSPHQIPLWLSTDHEGGPTFTMRRYGATAFPGNLALGAAGSEKYARLAARDTAEELRSMGIAIDFAPSVDVNNNPSNPIIGLRSFGEDPARVAALGVAAARGYREGNLLYTPKHFPGHGDTTEDSHLGLPVSTKTLAELNATELVPFRAVIADGAPAIMTAHIVFPALGTAPGQSVTLSSAVLTDFLRGKLGFQGLIFSDNLDMGAIANVYGSSEAAVLSLLAGDDVLMLGKGDFPAALAAVVAAVQSGRLPRARLEESVDRILAAKERLGVFKTPAAPRALETSVLSEHQSHARQIAEAAVTLVRNDGTLPIRLKSEQSLGLILMHSPRYLDESAFFAAEITKRHPRIQYLDIPTVFPSSATVESASAKFSTAPIVVVGTYQFGPSIAATQGDLIRRLTARGARVIAVSLMNPYDLAISTSANAAVCAYGMTTSALEASARLLFGEIRPKGRLPVTVPGVANLGAGL